MSCPLSLTIANEYSEPNISELYQLGNPDSELVYCVLLQAADQFYLLFKTYTLAVVMV